MNMRPRPESPAVPFDVFLIGDTGSINRNKPDPVMEMLKSHLSPEQESAVIFLGDNVYPRGLPEKGHLLRNEAEATLVAHHEALKDYHGRVIFIGGNHDWNKGRRNGLDYIIRQEKFLEKLFDGKNVFLPSNGCPGPSEVNIHPGFVIVLINTQWWMQRDARPLGKASGCRVSSESEFFDELKAILDRHSGKKILVCGHHPVYSYAIHGGRFKLKHHIFPLTLYDKSAYLPLPILGSLLPLYRKWVGAKEDMSHPRYRNLRNRLNALFSEYPNLVYASGHEHNLQYISKNHNHFIVSGAGSKLKYVLQTGKHLQFGRKSKGFFKLRFEPGGEVIASAWVLDHRHPGGAMAFEKQIIDRSLGHD